MCRKRDLAEIVQSSLASCRRHKNLAVAILSKRNLNCKALAKPAFGKSPFPCPKTLFWVIFFFFLINVSCLLNINPWKSNTLSGTALNKWW